MGAAGRTARRLKAGFALVSFALATLAVLAPQNALAQAPDKPSGLAATPGAGNVVLTWNAQPDQQITQWLYQVKLSTDNWPAASSTINGTGATTSLTITRTTISSAGLTNGMSYDFRIRARSGSSINTSPWSDVVTATPTATPPVTITLTATPGNARIDLSWTYSGSTTGASKWQVEYFTGSTGDQWRDIPGGVAARSVALPLAGRPALVNDDTYNIRLRLATSRGDTLAQTVIGNTGWVTATPTASTTTTVPAAPTNLTATGAGTTQVLLTWTKPAGTITGYKLRHAKTPSKASATWAAMAGSGANTVRHMVTSLDDDAEYSFMIRAVNASGDGAATGWVTATPMDSCPSVLSPTNLSLAPRSDGFVVTWTAPTDVFRNGWTLSYGKTGGSSTSVTISNAAATSRTLTGLDANTEYEISLTATHSTYNPSAVCPPGFRVKTTGTTADAGPTITLTATAGDGRVTLSWTYANDDGEAFDHWRYAQKKGGGSYSGLGDEIPGGKAIRTHTVTGLENGAAYTFKVTRGVTSPPPVRIQTTAPPYSNEVTATPTAASVPARPSGLSAEAGNGQVELTWTDPDDDSITRYQLRRRKGSAAWGGWTAIPGSDADTVSHTVTGLDNDVEYRFRIRARNSGGNSAQSAVVEATPSASAAVPKPVLSAEAGYARVTLSWSALSGVTVASWGYEYKSAGGSWSTTATVSDGGATSHTVTGLTIGTEYTFRLFAAVGPGVQSVWSDEVKATPTNTVPKPVLTAAAGDRSATLSWSALSGIPITSWGYQYKSTGGWSTTTTVTGGSTTSATVTGLTGGTEHTFRLFAAVGPGVQSVWSDEVTATPYALAAPVLTGATSNAPNLALGVRLTWTHSGDLLPAGATWWYWRMGHRLRGGTDWRGTARTGASAVLSARTVDWGLDTFYPEGAVVEVRIRGRGINDRNGLWSNIRTVTLSDDDDDRPALTIAGAPVTVAPGSTATYTVALTKAYAGTLSIASDDTSAATVSPPSLAFTTTNYNTAKTVTVTGVGNGTATIDHAFRLTGAAADAIPDAGTVDVTVAAVPGVTVSPTSLTIDEGGSGAYTLRLNTAPAANVTVTVGGASGEVTVAGSPLTFTPANHGTAQTVTVGAGADADTANDRATLTHTSASTDNDYGAALAIDSVSVTVRDTTPGAGGTDPTPPPESPTGGMTYQQLDGAGGLAPEPVEYARELVVVPAGKTTVNIKSPVAAVATATRHRVAAALGRRILVDESVHVRLALGGGMVFAEGKNVGDIGWRWSANPLRPPSSCTMENGAAFTNPDHVTSAGKAIGTSLVAGRAGESVAVFRLETGADDDFGLDLPSRDGGRHLPPEARAVAGGGPKCGTPHEPTRIFADIADHLAVPAGGGAYTAGISLHGDADDALAGRNASVALGGAATIVRVVDGLDAGVEAATQPVVAHVGTSPQPFLWFRDAAAAGGVTGAAVLGSARATIAGNNLHNPTTGGIATGSDLLPDGSVNLAVEGDFSIGAFSLGIPADAADPSGVCPAAGAAGSPATGNLAPAAGGPPDRATLGGRNAGTHHLCVRVAAANGAPIPAGLYRGTVSRTGVGDADETLATGVIGRIRRNGTTARLTYLTASGKYNQRLIIVNEGARDARYDLGSLVTEAGTRATPTAAAVGTVPAGGQVVLRVSDLVEFAGPRRRASATLSVVAAPGDIRVATTQVNLLDGSTDTLHIPVRGATVN